MDEMYAEVAAAGEAEKQAAHDQLEKAERLFKEEAYAEAGPLFEAIFLKTQHKKFFERCLNCYRRAGNQERLLSVLRSISGNEKVVKEFRLIALFAEARVYSATKTYDAVLRCFKSIIALDPDYALDCRRALVAAAQFDSPEGSAALAQLDALLGKVQKPVSENYFHFEKQGDELAVQGKSGQALTEYLQAYELKQAPDLILMTKIARQYMRRKDQSVARRWLAEARSYDPSDPVVNTLLGQSYLYEKQYDRAREFFDIADAATLKKNNSGDLEAPTERFALVLKARSFLKEGNYSDAKKYAEEAVRSVQNGNTCAILGEVYERLKEYGTARQWYTKATEFEKDNRYVHYLLARACYLEGNPAMTRKVLAPFLQGDRTDKDMAVLFAMTLAKEDMVLWNMLRTAGLYDFVVERVKKYHDDPASLFDDVDDASSGLQANNLWAGAHITPIDGRTARQISDHELIDEEDGY